MKEKLIILMLMGIFLVLKNFEVFAFNIPEPQAKIECSYDGKWYKPEEYRIYCKPPSSTQPIIPVSPGRLSIEQQMTLMMMQSILQPLFNAMVQDLFTPRDTLREQIKQQELIRQQEEAKRKQEEMKRQALEAWKKILKEMEAEMARQEARRKETGQKILAQSRIGEDVKLEPSLFGSTQVKLNPGSISTLSGYPAPESEVDRTRCAAYFSKLARNTRDPEGAKFLSLQAEKVMQGAPTDYPCQFEKMPEIPVPQSYAKNEEVLAFINIYQAKLKELEEIQVKVNEARKKKSETEARLEEAESKINELQAKLTTTSKPEEKAQLDDLLSQAIAAKQQAEMELTIAQKNEQVLLDLAKQKADEIRGMDEQISALKGESK